MEEAEWLIQMDAVDLFLWINVPDATAVQRMEDRRITADGRTYSVHNMPTDVEVRRRTMDSKPWDRIQEYRTGTLPILEDVLLRCNVPVEIIDGCGSATRVIRDVIDRIQPYKRNHE